MHKILAVVVALICVSAVAAQEPTNPTPAAASKTKPAKLLLEAYKANIQQRLLMLRAAQKNDEKKALGQAIQVKRLVAQLRHIQHIQKPGTRSHNENNPINQTPETEALEATLRHIAHLASQAAHTTDLDVVEKKLRDMEQQVMDARVKLWQARDAESRKVKKEKGKRVRRGIRTRRRNGLEARGRINEPRAARRASKIA